MKQSRLRLIVATLGLAILSACSSTDNAPEPADLPKITEFNQLPLVWSQRVATADDMVFTPWLAQTGVVYAASAKGLVEGYEFATGKRVLELKTGKPLSGGIGL